MGLRRGDWWRGIFGGIRLGIEGVRGEGEEGVGGNLEAGGGFEVFEWEYGGVVMDL